MSPPFRTASPVTVVVRTAAVVFHAAIGSGELPVQRASDAAFAGLFKRGDSGTVTGRDRAASRGPSHDYCDSRRRAHPDGCTILGFYFGESKSGKHSGGGTRARSTTTHGAAGA